MAGVLVDEIGKRVVGVAEHDRLGVGRFVPVPELVVARGIGAEQQRIALRQPDPAVRERELVLARLLDPAELLGLGFALFGGERGAAAGIGVGGSEAAERERQAKQNAAHGSLEPTVFDPGGKSSVAGGRVNPGSDSRESAPIGQKGRDHPLMHRLHCHISPAE